MAEITAAMVKELRERTGAGMMDCKKALVEAAGDAGKAAEILEKSRKGKVDKAAGKIAADGMIVAEVSPDGLRGVIVEVNSQTDFVARGQDFQDFAKAVGKRALESGATDVAALETAIHDGKTLRQHAEDLTAKSGEKHAIRRVERYEAPAGKGVVTAYIHFGSRLGVLVDVRSEKGNTPDVKEFADEVALQIASMGPRYVSKTDVPAEPVAKQREIFVAQVKDEEDQAAAEVEDWKRRMAEDGAEHSDAVVERLKTLEKKAASLAGRPQAAKDKIAEGKLAKWLTEVVLLDQISVKDSKKTIAQLLAEFSSKHGKTEIARFARFELGEGVDKGTSKDFATEVAEMAAASQKN